MHAPETDGLDIERFLAKRRVLETFKEDVDLLEALVIALAEDQVAFPANAEDFIDLLFRPDVELAFLAFAVCVLGRIKSSIGRGHVSENVGKDFPSYFGILFLFRHLMAL